MSMIKKMQMTEASCSLQNRFQKTPASETGSPALSTRIPKTDRSLRFMFQRSPLGQSVPLRVKDVSSIGAFLDWGLEKDLFLPFKEQIGHIRPGREYLVSLYIDKSSRLCATMKIGKLLSTDHSYHAGDWVLGTIYNIHPDHGAFVAVEDQYLGRIPKQEIHEKLSVGDHLRMRITSVASDGKLNLSLHEKAYLQMDRDAKLVMDTIESYDGALPFNDKAKPAVIERELGLSKNAFKRAVGRLLKEGKITITPTGILKK